MLTSTELLRRLWPRCGSWTRPGTNNRRWLGRQLAAWHTQAPLVVLFEGALKTGWLQKSVPHRRNHQIADQSIGSCQRLLDAACVGACSNVQFCSDFLI